MPTMCRPVLVLCAIALVSTLAGCSGLDVSNADLPTPSIAQGSAPAVCGSPAGAATMTLSDVLTRVTLDAPATTPRNRVDVAGTSSGLDPAAVVVLFLLPISTDCPAYTQTTVALQADGSFTGTLDLTSVQKVRVVAIAAPAGAVVSCTSLDSCISVAGHLAVSNTLDIRIR